MSSTARDKLAVAATASLAVLCLMTGLAQARAVKPQVSSAPRTPVVVSSGPATPGLGHVDAPVPELYAPPGFSYGSLARTYNPSFDLRSLGKVTPVRNQNPHGTCWAFAALASTESCLLTGETWDFSEDNLAYFHGFDWTYEQGGNSYVATASLTRWGEPFTEAQDPYNDNVHPDPGTLDLQKHVQDVVYLPARTSATDNDNLKYALTTWGAVDVSIYWQDASYNFATNSYYYTGGKTWNHDITVVGWDDNYAKTNFSPQPTGNGAFLIKNSWGTGWGNAGYFWISYYDTAFGYDSGSAVFRATEPTSNYGRIYQYDPLGYCTSIGYGAGTAIYGAGRYVAQGDSQLKALGFWTLGVNTSYVLYCGTSLSALTANGSGTLIDMGFHTVALTTPVGLTSGSPFYVAVKLTTPGYSWPLAYEAPYSGYSSAAVASTNQSFFGPDGSSWTDLTSFETNASVCLKAYTGAPAGTMSVNGGATYTTSTTVTLGSSVTGGTQMCFRDAGGSWTTWASYAGSRSWTLPAGDGAKTVEARYRDMPPSALSLSDSIVLDATRPVTSDNTTGLSYRRFTLVLSPTDATSGVATTRYSIDGGAWQTGTTVTLATAIRHKRGGYASGVHTVQYTSTDNAGNAETPRSCSVTLQ
jgi:C1A family cysteine protease